MKQPSIELLAPAGTLSSLRAALAAGADAVYLGSASFGARADAGFDAQALKEAVDTAHLFGRRVHVTVNTLVKQKELAAVEETLRTLQSLHVDAVLVQDLGVLFTCLEKFPALPVHASTQMALSGAYGARLMKRFGAVRVVLARECTLPEIRRAAKEGIEIEVFAHGALCVCASGLCLFSAMIGGRSGNRGRCAQPCRMQYAYRGQTKAWLSPADLCTRDDLPALMNAGARSLKIEGRLKRPEYVYIVTRAYRNALCAAQKDAFTPMDALERDALTQIFSRGAFTKGYAGGSQDADVLYPARVKPVGLAIGTVLSCDDRRGTPFARCLLSRALGDGDGLEIGDQRLIYSGAALQAGQTALLRLREPAKRGEQVRRTEDEAQLSAARASYEGEAFFEALQIPFDAALTAHPGEHAILTASSGEARVSVTGEIVLPAQSKPLSEALVRRALEKTGGTPFRLKACVYTGENAFLPAAALNALRRDALDALSKALISRHEEAIPVRAPFTLLPRTAPEAVKRRILVRSGNITLLKTLLAHGADCALYAPEDFRPEALEKALSNFPGNAALCLPPVMSDDALDALCALLKGRNIPVMAGSVGQLGAPFEGPILSGCGVPMMNGRAEALLASLGISAAVLSPEMSAADIFDLPAPLIERILPVYGRVRLMTLAHCPERVYRGLQKGRESCALCARKEGAKGQCLTDKFGCEYPLRPVRLPEGCRVDVLSDKPLNLLTRPDLLSGLDVSYLLSFTDEEEDRALSILNAYRAFLATGTVLPMPVRGTVGRFTEGVL